MFICVLGVSELLNLSQSENESCTQNLPSDRVPYFLS